MLKRAKQVGYLSKRRIMTKDIRRMNVLCIGMRVIKKQNGSLSFSKMQ